MSTELLKNTQGIRGFQHQNFEFSGNFLIWRIKRTEIRCPQCGSTDVSADFLRIRRVQALPCGNRQTYLEFAVHRVYCPHCRDRSVEKFHFLESPKSRITNATAKNTLDARAAFRRWATMAEETGIAELRSMAATIREKLNGIITFWTYRHLSNASTEGFNNKIRWLMRKAYGFRDYVYLKLKIFQLPSLRNQKEL